MATRFSNPVTQYLDSNGDPFDGGKLAFFTTGTSTPLNTFSDQAGTIPNANPVILDASGRTPDIFLDGTYRVTLKDKNDVLIWDRDPISSSLEGLALSDWNAVVSYSIGDLVTGSDGNRYESLTNSNLNNDPTTSAANWKEIQFVEIYNVNVTYAINDMVKASNGLLYTSLTTSNLNNDPLTDTVNWRPASDLTAEAAASVSTYNFDTFFGF